VNGDKEGIPGTIVQAMATGLPIVETLHAGIPEIVEDGRHGFLVPERDVPRITDALLKLIDNSQLRQQMGQAAAVQAAQKADARKKAAHLETIYQELLRHDC
jgi:colanic acid/amylovoran biosynthesis glycosyltransferase